VIVETERQPFSCVSTCHRHPRTAPALYQVSIVGPFDATGAGDTPSRRTIFGKFTAHAGRSGSSATRDDGPRNPHAAHPARLPPARDRRRTCASRWSFFRDGCADGAGFDAGMESAISAVLVSPRFFVSR